MSQVEQLPQGLVGVPTAEGFLDATGQVINLIEAAFPTKGGARWPFKVPSKLSCSMIQWTVSFPLGAWLRITNHYLSTPKVTTLLTTCSRLLPVLNLIARAYPGRAVQPCLSCSATSKKFLSLHCVTAGEGQPSPRTEISDCKIYTLFLIT